TLGSDAHRPEETGAGFDQALELMKSAGVPFLARWKGREMTMIPFEQLTVPSGLDSLEGREYVASNI
ncbi:MAG TPA: hypothetical protein VLA34_04215, partial [Candidatus Krumholzibacterium sp.]|nr:hypothetical protein [Candidatus Krumholzibacterium sp.]